MPGYRTHISVAIMVYIILAVITWSIVISWPTRLLGLVALCIGALFPDIDTKSKGQQYLYHAYALCLGLILALYVMHRTQLWVDLIICLAIITIAPLLARHRGITHNPRFILLCSIVFWIVS